MKLWKMTITIKDNKGKLSRMLVYYPYNDVGNSESPSAYRLGVDEVIDHILPVLDQMVKGQIISVNLSLELDLPVGLKTSPDIDSDVEEGAIFRYYTNNPRFYFEHRIPTFDESLFVDGEITQNTTVPAYVTNWILYLTQPEDVLPNHPGIVDNRGTDLKNINWRAWEDFNKSGKR